MDVRFCPAHGRTSRACAGSRSAGLALLPLSILLATRPFFSSSTRPPNPTKSCLSELAVSLARSYGPAPPASRSASSRSPRTTARGNPRWIHQAGWRRHHLLVQLLHSHQPGQALTPWHNSLVPLVRRHPPVRRLRQGDRDRVLPRRLRPRAPQRQGTPFRIYRQPHAYAAAVDAWRLQRGTPPLGRTCC